LDHDFAANLIHDVRRGAGLPHRLAFREDSGWTVFSVSSLSGTRAVERFHELATHARVRLSRLSAEPLTVPERILVIEAWVASARVLGFAEALALVYGPPADSMLAELEILVEDCESAHALISSKPNPEADWSAVPREQT